MIDVKQAVGAAREFAAELYGPELKLRLEEVDLSPDERYWFITLGIEEPIGPVAAFALAKPPRDYKVFKVDATDGQVISMKIRSAA